MTMNDRHRTPLDSLVSLVCTPEESWTRDTTRMDLPKHCFLFLYAEHGNACLKTYIYTTLRAVYFRMPYLS